MMNSIRLLSVIWLISVLIFLGCGLLRSYMLGIDFSWPYCGVEDCLAYVILCLCGIFLIGCWGWGAVCSIISWIKKRHHKFVLDSSNSFYTDFPSMDDCRGRSASLEILLSRLIATSNKLEEGSFAILLNEVYGAGKTSFLLQLSKKMEESELHIRYAWFKPWLFDSQETMRANLLQIIAEKVGNKEWKIQHDIRRYARTISDSSGSLIFALISALSSGESIEKQYEEIKCHLSKLQKPIYILVDDVDRLEPSELNAFLKLIRNTASFPYITYIVAGDRSLIEKQLQLSGITEPDIYLRKFFNYEFLFPAEENGISRELESLLKKVCSKFVPTESQAVIDEAVLSILSMDYLPLYLPTLRDVKRYVNIVSLELERLKQGGLLEKEIVLVDLLLVLLLQYVDIDIYRLLRDHPRQLLTSEGTFLRLRQEASNILISRETSRSLDEYFKKVVDTDRPIETHSLDKDSMRGDTFKYHIRTLCPTDAEKIGAILEHLFNGTARMNGINNVGEYYKYFANHYREDEVSEGETELLLSMTDNVELKKQIDIFLAKGKIINLSRKINWSLQLGSYNVPTVLSNLSIIFPVIYSAYGQSGIAERFWTHYVHLLFTTNHHIEDNSIIEELTQWFRKFDNVFFCIDVILELQNTAEDFRPSIFSREEYDEWVSIIQQRFINECFEVDTYSENTMSYYGLVRKLHERNFVVLQHKAMKRMKDSCSYFYRMICKEDDKWNWNKDYCQKMCEWPISWSGSVPPYFAVLPKDEKKDLLELGKDAYRERFLTMEHPFVQAASNWWMRQAQ